MVCKRATSSPDNPYNTEMARSKARLAFYFILTSIITTFFMMMSPTFIQEGMDPSWREALLHARYVDLGFGNQIVYSGGPLSIVYTRVFSSSFFHERLLSLLLFTGF